MPGRHGQDHATAEPLSRLAPGRSGAGARQHGSTSTWTEVAPLGTASVDLVGAIERLPFVIGRDRARRKRGQVQHDHRHDRGHESGARREDQPGCESEASSKQEPEQRGRHVRGAQPTQNQPHAAAHGEHE
jgi:hypothetical protein